MRILVTGGGTGGHIYPALAIARGIREKNAENEILYVGTAGGMEADIVPRHGFSFQTVTVEGFPRKLSLRALTTIFMTSRGCVEAYKIIRQFKPDVAVGTGGYVCGPVMLMAALMKVPTLIHEQNAYPGLTNRLLAGRVKKVAVTFPESRKYFSAKADIVVTGLPVRPEILAAQRSKGITSLGLKRDKFTLLVVGGSRGARTINIAMVDVIEQVSKQKSLQLIHMTGQDGFGETVRDLKDRGIVLDNCGNIIVTPYLHNMDEALAAADLVICRAGAATIAEITVRGLPAILVPYPYASGNHQEHNAKALVRNGAALMVLDRNLTGKRLWEEVEKLSTNKIRLAELADNSARMGKPQALDRLLNIIDRLGRQ